MKLDKTDIKILNILQNNQPLAGPFEFKYSKEYLIFFLKKNQGGG